MIQARNVPALRDQRHDSVHLVSHGASAVDESALAIEIGAENARTNGLAGRVRFERADARRVMQDAHGAYDLTIVDPPRLAPTRNAREQALVMYSKLAELGCRATKPGGLLVLSSLLPDADASGLFTRLVQKVERTDEEALPEGWKKKTVLASIRSFMNDAQALVELEEAGTFDFFDPERLSGHLEEAGFTLLQRIETFGEPPQGYIFVAGVKHGRD